ncbi:MAG: diphosphomevalonate decarboxylase [Bacteroidetes bacterium]|nr:diphosphomevalonate decarboxylase [Bacteroidota bacterium]
MSLVSFWQAPSNIAIVKYWGKYGIQLPCNSSISLSLEAACTQTKVEVLPLSGKGTEVHFYLDGERKESFETKIWTLLHLLGDDCRFWKEHSLRISSSNTFPHSAGIASSASGMAALALCLLDLEFKFREQERPLNFFQIASSWARLGSGSACRSLFGGFVSWGKAEGLNSSLEEGAPLPFQVHSVFKGMKDAILLVDQAEKKVSSTIGHGLMVDHWFSERRFLQAEAHTQRLLSILKEGDAEGFVELTEAEALSLHAMMMTSASNYLLMRPNTIAVIEEIRAFRKQTGLPVCFTLDAGPNIHLLYPATIENRVKTLIDNLTQDFCLGKNLIDSMGTGPVELNSKE